MFFARYNYILLDFYFKDPQKPWRDPKENKDSIFFLPFWTFREKTVARELLGRSNDKWWQYCHNKNTMAALIQFACMQTKKPITIEQSFVCLTHATCSNAYESNAAAEVQILSYSAHCGALFARARWRELN